MPLRIPTRFIRAVMFVLLLTGTASGGAVTVYFSGAFDYSNAPLIPAGTPFFGHFTYSTTDPVVSMFPDFFGYDLIPGDGITVTTNGFTFVGIPPDPSDGANVWNGPSDVYGNLDEFGIYTRAWRNNAGNYPGFLPNLILQIVGNLNFLTSKDLPSVFNSNDVILGPLQTPTSLVLFLENANINEGRTLVGNLSSISAVPEPASFGLVAMAFSICLLWYRRQLRAR